MTRIPENDRDIMEQAMYLPMLLTVLERDRLLIENAGLKLKDPYIQLIEKTIKAVQKDLRQVKDLMRSGQMKVEQVARDEIFTMYLFIYKGFEEKHNYFNPRIRNKINELLGFYLHKKGDF